MAYWALEALDGSKTALSSLDRVEGTDPPAFKLGRRPHEESHFGALPICVSRNQAQLTPCHDGVAIRHSGSAPTGVLRHHGAFDSNEDVGQWVWLTQEMGSTVIRHGDTIALTRGVNATAIQPQLVPTTVMFRLKWVCTKEALIERVKEMRDLAHNEQGNKKVYHLGRLAFDILPSELPAGEIEANDIDRLRTVKHVGEWAVGQLHELRTTSSCSYLKVLRLRALHAHAPVEQSNGAVERRD